MVLILFNIRGFLDRVDGQGSKSLESELLDLDEVGSVGLRGVENGSVHSRGLPLGDLALIKVQLSDSGLDRQFELTLKFTLSDIISFLQVFVIRNVDGISVAFFVSNAEVLGLKFLTRFARTLFSRSGSQKKAGPVFWKIWQRSP